MANPSGHGGPLSIGTDAATTYVDIGREDYAVRFLNSHVLITYSGPGGYLLNGSGILQLYNGPFTQSAELNYESLGALTGGPTTSADSYHTHPAVRKRSSCVVDVDFGTGAITNVLQVSDTGRSVTVSKFAGYSGTYKLSATNIALAVVSATAMLDRLNRGGDNGDRNVMLIYPQFMSPPESSLDYVYLQVWNVDGGPADDNMGFTFHVDWP
jgi:hypothetical protein